MADSKTSGKEIKLKNNSKISNNNDSDDSSSDEAAGDEGSQLQLSRGAGKGSVTVDREEYLQALRDLTFDKSQQQIKNNILHRRLAEYYKKRKLEHVLKTIERASDLEEKYHQKLLTYEELKEQGEREVTDIRAKVQHVEGIYKQKLKIAIKNFDDLQYHERNTGTGLIYSKKGKPIADKTVDRLLLLQRHKSEQCSALRLRYIRARNAVAELEAVVKKLEMIGPGLYVFQFEQLDIDHENYLAKIEEREDELVKIRTRCSEENQILAHIREKMHHTDEVIDFTECDLGDAEIEYERAREDLGEVKTRRDKLRLSLESERIKAGLLTRKDLLPDFQDATDEVVKIREKKKTLVEQISKVTKQLREIRKLMQQPNKIEDELI